jgi:hypothetical protein
MVFNTDKSTDGSTLPVARLTAQPLKAIVAAATIAAVRKKLCMTTPPR